jgi:hypothetical protein
MAAGSPKLILGYVSAYLKQTLRTHAEAEQDNREQNASVEVGEPEISSDPQSNRGAARWAANRK